jgi:hypothetical protein
MTECYLVTSEAILYQFFVAVTTGTEMVLASFTLNAEVPLKHDNLIYLNLENLVAILRV